MISLGLRYSDHLRYLKLLASPHRIQINTYILDLEENWYSRIDQRLLEGQVNIDADAEISRTCSMTLLDPEAQLNLDTESPQEGALYMDRMIYVVYTVIDPDWSFWVNVPIFKGPVTKLDRNQDIVSIEASGKEALTMGWAWKPVTYAKNWPVAPIIEDILWTRAGERRTHIRFRSQRSPKRYSVIRRTIPWEICRRLARSISNQIFYDGRGVATLRAYPRRTGYTFRSGSGGVVKTPPTASYDLANVKNVVWVKGRKPKGKRSKGKKRPDVAIAAPRHHPLSPWRLGRNGVPMRLVEEIEDDSIRTKSAARRVARDRLRSLLLEEVDVAFDSLPVPHLEPMDVCRVSTRDFAASFRLKQMSIPLTADASSSIGYNRRLKPSRARIRRRGKR